MKIKIKNKVESMQFFFTEVSSEQDAIMFSKKGFHLMSSTLPWWPQTFGKWESRRPDCKRNRDYIALTSLALRHNTKTKCDHSKFAKMSKTIIHTSFTRTMPTWIYRRTKSQKYNLLLSASIGFIHKECQWRIEIMFYWCEGWKRK